MWSNSSSSGIETRVILVDVAPRHSSGDDESSNLALPELAKVEKAVNPAQQVIRGDVLIEVEWIEESVLIAALCSHHQEVLPNTAWADSISDNDWVMELARTARARGLRYIDAPVTGLPENAAAGTLTLLVGAESIDLESARPLLTAFSDRILRFGPVGTGTAYKLIINMIGAVQIASLAEGLVLAKKAAFDFSVVTQAITTGQAASPQVVRNTRRMAENDHERNVVFTPTLRLKDVAYALKLANTLGIGAPFGQLAAKGLQQLCAMRHAHANESKIIEVASLQKPEA